jgi:hypothetical protein
VVDDTDLSGPVGYAHDDRSAAPAVHHGVCDQLARKQNSHVLDLGQAPAVQAVACKATRFTD